MAKLSDMLNVPDDPRAAKKVVSEYRKQQYLEALKELADRRVEALNLYEPLPFQQAFHACRAVECLLRKGVRGGGSVAGFVEDARAATGRDPFDKYPKQDGVLVCLGYGENHIGRVIHRLLFRPGAFDIIRDEETKRWRTYRPWSRDEEIDGRKGDLERFAESTKAPPLIPERYIEGRFVWMNKGERVFTSVQMTTGWTIYAANSAGDPGQFQGFDVHLYHFDEDTATGGWLEEAQGRISRVGGLLRWTARQHARNDDMSKMIERADEQANEQNPTTVIISASIFDNIYYEKSKRDEMARVWKSMGDAVYRNRAFGEVVADSRYMYPTWSRSRHSAIQHDEPRLPIQKLLTELDGIPPAHWTRYMFLDPGHQRLAALFFAVPPPNEKYQGQPIGDFKVCYDELYLLNADARMLAVSLKEKTRGQTFERFVIDMQGGRLTGLAGGPPPFRKYEAEMAKHKIQCIRTGHRFAPAKPNIKGREEALRLWLAEREDGSPTILVVMQRCPNLARTMPKFRKKCVRIGGELMPIDERNPRSEHDAIDCLEYAAADGLPFVKHDGTLKRKLGRGDMFKAEEAQRKKIRSMNARLRGGKSTISLGPQGDAR